MIAVVLYIIHQLSICTFCHFAWTWSLALVELLEEAVYVLRIVMRGGEERVGSCLTFRRMAPAEGESPCSASIHVDGIFEMERDGARRNSP
jgi:hypothetical protein